VALRTLRTPDETTHAELIQALSMTKGWRFCFRRPGSALFARLEHHFGPPSCPLVKLLIALRRLVQREFVRDDRRRFGAARLDQLGKVAVVGFDVGLAGRDTLPL